MRLVNKMKLIFAAELVLIILMIVLAGRFAIDTGTATLKKTIESNLLHHASDMMFRINTGINNRVDRFREYTTDLTLKHALERSNSEFEEMGDTQAYIDSVDAEWTAADGNVPPPLMDEILTGELSEEISKKTGYIAKKFEHAVYGEVFVTNRYGAVVAASGRTSDYRQDDEAWWQEARERGLSLTGTYYDESSGVDALAAGIRVDDENGVFAGVIKVVIDMSFIKAVMDAPPQHDGQQWAHEHSIHTLMDVHGRVIYTSGNLDLSEIRHLLEAGPVYASRPSDTLIMGMGGTTVSLHVHSSEYSLPLNPEWVFFITARTDELYAPVRLIRRSILIVTVAVILVVILAGAYSTISLSRLISRVKAASARVKAGELDAIAGAGPRDELTELAEAFTRLTDEMKSSTIPRQYLDDLMSNMTTPLLVLDTEGTVLRTNAAAELLLDYPEYRLAGERIDTVVMSGTGGFVEEIVGSAGEVRVEVTIRTREGKWVPAVFSCTRLTGVNNGRAEIICSIEDMTKLKEREETISHLSYHDSLTGLPNKQQFIDRLIQIIALGQRRSMQCAVMILDLDRFKDINDAFGHSFGDELLQSVASRLVRNKRTYDLVARFGGDEFTIILPDINGADDIVSIVERVIGVLKAPHLIGGHEFYITSSIGVSVFPDDGDDAETLVKYAEAAMYQAKDAHSDTFRLFTPSMHATIAKRFQIEYRLNKALENKEFLLHYQPEVDTKTGRIIGFEALVRWQEPGGRLVPPGDFIPVAEHTGLIIPIGEWVLRTAAAQAREWQEMGFTGLTVAANLSIRQFRQGGLVETLIRVIRETGVDPKGFELELTESILMDDVETVIKTLVELKAMGLKLAIDDFGTGYSSLAYLKRMPIDKLKIDGSFVRNITTEKDDHAIATTIIRMAHAMDLDVIAEQVETTEQRDMLATLQCDSFQGYLFSKPLPAAEATRLLLEKSQQA